MNLLLLSLVQAAAGPTAAVAPTDWSAVGSLTGALIAAVATVLVWWQLREMKRATLAQAFWPVAMFLQEDAVREARRILLSTTESDFAKWTDIQKSHAEVACNAYDVTGIMLKRTVIDHKMVTAEWRQSIIDCWARSEPIRTAYRLKRGKDYWNDFEWLYNKAKGGA